MPIENHVPDGTFVKEIAALVHPTPRVERLQRGQSVVLAGERIELLGTPLLAEPTTLRTSTLSSVVQAYTDLAKFAPGGATPIVHVMSPTAVQIVAPSVGEERQQFVFLRAEAETPRLAWDTYRPLGEFIVFLLSNLCDSGERDRVLEYVSSLTAGLAADITDDGASQTVVAKRGITRAGAATKFDNPVHLAPFRTFPEIDQPGSSFILRLRQERSGEEITATAALFEADGGAWKTEAIRRIGLWLAGELPEGTTVLA